MTQNDPEQLAARTALFPQMQAIARHETLPLFRADPAVDNKLENTGAFDPVTQADRGCEKALRALILERFANDGIIGEEYGTQNEQADYVWVIDPIDGTRAYVSGVPLWGTLVGLMHQGKPVASLAFQPFINEAFALNEQGPVWSQGNQTRRLQTRACAQLSTATMMTTTPALFDPKERSAYDQVESQVRSIRYGTDWYAYALIAAGTCDIVIESGLSPYDILPLVALIEAAGGQATDWSGRPLRAQSDGFTGQVLAVGDPKMNKRLLPMLAPAVL